MTKLLQEALSKVSQLTPDRQDAIAQWLLEELDSDTFWDRLLSESGDALERLAQEALDEHNRGETRELVPDNL